MRIIVRKTKSTTWSGATTGADIEERRSKAVATFRRSPDDTDGVSVYLVTSERERGIVLSGFACDAGHDDPIDLLELDESEVLAFGEVSLSPGTSAYPPANELHRALDWTPEQLELFAKTMFEQGKKASRYTRTCLKSLLAALNSDDVTTEKARKLIESVRSKG